MSKESTTGPLAPLFAAVRDGLLFQDARAAKALAEIERHVQDMETALDTARLVADMHESGEGFQWVGSEDDTEALDALCRALAALPAREKGTE